MKRLAALILAVLFAAMLPCGSALAALRGQAGSEVSAFSSHCIDGSQIDGSAFEAYSVSIVTLWATWDAASLNQLEYLARVHEMRPDIGVFGLLYLDATSTAEAALAYMQEHGYTLPVFTADTVWSGVISQAAFLPQSFFVSPGGVILEACHGAFTDSAAMLDTAVGLAGAAGTYTVRFYDRINGSCALLASYGGLSYGASVAAPAAPQHAGYEFTGWSTDAYSYVTGNIDVFAVYASNGPDGDVDASGVTDSYDALLVLRGVMGIALVTPLMTEHGDMDGSGTLTAYDALLILRLVLHV